MAKDLKAFQRHHQAMLGEMPVSVTIGTSVYPNCTKTVVSLDRLFLSQGDLDAYVFSVHMSQDYFKHGSLPAVKTKVTISSVVYRILAVNKDTYDIGIILDLGAKFSNRG